MPNSIFNNGKNQGMIILLGLLIITAIVFSILQHLGIICPKIPTFLEKVLMESPYRYGYFDNSVQGKGPYIIQMCEKTVTLFDPEYKIFYLNSLNILKEDRDLSEEVQFNIYDRLKNILITDENCNAFLDDITVHKRESCVCYKYEITPRIYSIIIERIKDITSVLDWEIKSTKIIELLQVFYLAYNKYTSSIHPEVIPPGAFVPVSTHILTHNGKLLLTHDFKCDPINLVTNIKIPTGEPPYSNFTTDFIEFVKHHKAMP